MAAVAVFTCRQNSHPFQERQVQLTESVKVGRSVARARPAPNNAIFDCKVLSRNHAVLWYENAKFFLQDTKSSNGTFINNQRLSKGSEESPPRELFSGDIVQFGVDVMENSRKVTHGCIIASIQLFHPDGREATRGPSNPFVTGPGSAGATLQSQELYQLAQYLQEALHREQMLENKLATLQRLVSSTQEASESGWQALIDEDRLLSRLEVLENQLQTYSKNQTEDSLRQELTALQEDKYNYETTAKESLRKMLQEKLDAVRKLSELERSLSNTEDECSHLKEMCDNSTKELQQLAEKHEEQLKEMHELQERLTEAEKNHKEEYDKVEKEKAELQTKLDEMVKQENILTAKIPGTGVESLQADNDFTKEQLTNMKTKMEAIKEKDGDNQYIPEFESTGVQVELVNLLDLQLLGNSANSDDDSLDESDLREQLRETQLQIEHYKAQMKDSESRLQESKGLVEKLQNQLEQAKLECVSHMAKYSSLEERLSQSDVQMNQVAENAIADLKIQLNESRKQSDNSGQLAAELKDQVASLENELHQYRADADRRNQLPPTDTNDVTNSNSIPNHIDGTIGTNHLKEEIERLKELLQEARASQKKSESEVDRVKRELDDASLRAKKASEETMLLQKQLTDTQRKNKDKTDQNSTLQDQLNKAETTTKEVKQQILALREQLQDAQQAAKQSRNEAEQHRMRLQVLQEELEAQRARARGESTEAWGVNRTDEDKDVVRATQAQMNYADRPTGVEFSALREECANLRRRIQDIEIEMKTSRRENHQLQTDYSKLQDSYKELEALKDRLETQEMTWKINLTDAQKEAEQSKRELTEANNEVAVLREKCCQYKEELAQLKQQLDDMDEEYQLLAYRSRTLSTCSMVPILLLLFAILLGFYPTLSTITATTTPT